MGKEAAARVEMDSFNHHRCSMPHLMGMQTQAGAIPTGETTNLVDACRMEPEIQDKTVKGTDKMVTMVTMEDQTKTKTIKNKIALAIGPAGAALAGMVDPVADPAEDLVVDLLGVAGLQVADLLVDLLMGQVVDLVVTPEDPEDPEGQMGQGGQVA